MELFIPLLILGFLVLLALGFFFARRDTGKGPHPDQTPSVNE
jgi:hypothetical protein